MLTDNRGIPLFAFSMVSRNVESGFRAKKYMVAELGICTREAGCLCAPKANHARSIREQRSILRIIDIGLRKGVNRAVGYPVRRG
jgi:hypothetical protein